MNFDLKSLKLKPKEIRLCEAIAGGENKVEAYKRIYNPKTTGKNPRSIIGSQVAKVLDKHPVWQYLTHLMDQMHKRNTATLDRCLAKLTCLAFDDSQETRDQIASLKEIIRSLERTEALKNEKIGEDSQGRDEADDTAAILRSIARIKERGKT